MKYCLQKFTSLRYADNSTVNQHCRVKDLRICCNNYEKDLFTDSNLVIDEIRTKLI